MQFRYFVIHRDNLKNDPRGLFVVDADGGDFPIYRASYSYADGRWISNPAIIDFFHGDNDDQSEEVDRPAAEDVARRRGIPMPSDDELERIVLDAVRDD